MVRDSSELLRGRLEAEVPEALPPEPTHGRPSWTGGLA
jgi:hypothetical protein